MPMISSSPASGRPNIGSMAATTTSEARGTPAMPLLDSIITRSSVTCWPSDMSMPYACAMKIAAKAW